MDAATHRLAIAFAISEERFQGGGFAFREPRRLRMNSGVKMFPDFNSIASYAFFFLINQKWERDSRPLFETLLHTAHAQAHCRQRCALRPKLLLARATARRVPGRKFTVVPQTPLPPVALPTTTPAGSPAHPHPANTSSQPAT